MSFVLVVSIFSLVSSKIKPHDYSKVVSPYGLALLTIVIMLGFNRMVYYSYLPNTRIEFEATATSVSTFLQKYLHPYEQFAYYYTVPQIYSLINILLVVLILTPIVVGIVRILYKTLIKKYYMSNHFSSLFCIQVAIMSVLFVDLMIYSIAGVLTFRYILFMFPIVSIAFLWKFFERESL